MAIEGSNGAAQYRRSRKPRIGQQIIRVCHSGFSASPKYDRANMTSSDNAPALNMPTHMEWKGDSFTPSHPEQPPTLTVLVEILQHVHQRFGKKFSPLQTHTEIETVARSGCQTCTAGPELLTKLKCPPTFLIRTNHCIVRIMDPPLSITGTVFLNINIGKKLSKQMIYISKNCGGLKRQ